MKVLAAALGVLLMGTRRRLRRGATSNISCSCSATIPPQRAESDSGKPCTISFNSGVNAGLSSIEIVRPPKHGSAGWNGSIGYPTLTYRSPPGYKGPDDFVYGVTGGGGMGIPGGYLKAGTSRSR